MPNIVTQVEHYEPLLNEVHLLTSFITIYSDKYI